MNDAIQQNEDKGKQLCDTKRRVRKRKVCFCKPVVTDVKEVPGVPADEMDIFFYSRKEIAIFRASAMARKKKKNRRKLIQFSDEVVTAVHYIPRIAPEELSTFFYTDAELGTILEEYISSSAFLPEGMDDDDMSTTEDGELCVEDDNTIMSNNIFDNDEMQSEVQYEGVQIPKAVTFDTCSMTTSEMECCHEVPVVSDSSIGSESFETSETDASLMSEEVVDERILSGSNIRNMKYEDPRLHMRMNNRKHVSFAPDGDMSTIMDDTRLNDMPNGPLVVETTTSEDKLNYSVPQTFVIAELG